MATTTSSTPVTMGGPTGATPPPGPGTAPSPIPQQWQQPPMQHPGGESSNLRSVTPAMNNTRGAVSSHGSRYPARQASPVRQASPGRAAHNYGGGMGAGAPSPHTASYGRSGTPQRYYGAYGGNPVNGAPTNGGGMAMGIPGTPPAASPQLQQQSSQQPPQPLTPTVPSSTGLIRLTLRKPMGIVFEPMYDPHNPSMQRGVRICDLPRTGAAALSRTLEVGDELLSINDKTMSRLTFDEIMDFIIEADPDQVNLLFRRPRKEKLAARPDQPPTPSNTNNTNGVKWVDDDHRQPEKEEEVPHDEKRKDRSEKKKSSPTKSSRKDDDETLQSSEDERQRRRRKKRESGRSGRRSRGSRRSDYEQESFLDMLIDSICANTDNVCRDGDRRGEDDYYSDDDGTVSGDGDDSTYVTYESDDTKEKKRSSKSKSKSKKKDYYEEETATEDDSLSRLEKKKALAGKAKKSPPKKHHYEDDGTLETEVSADRAKEVAAIPIPVPSSPLGLEPPPPPIKKEIKPPSPEPEAAPDAPIAELEYDGQFDHGADVSVMESLGGPSLLIEKQRQANMVAANVEGITENVVSRDLITKFGTNYPADFGYSSEQTIQRAPMRFYTYVVKMLLEEHEPEKVRLLDKLLAKYKGREEHLVRKLSVRYDRAEDQSSAIPNNSAPVPMPEDAGANAAGFGNEFSKMDINQENAERAQMDEWPITEKKEDEPGQLYSDSGEKVGSQEDQSQGSYTESEFSGDSIDGTSPAVIAQVSELLNYVYGKTSVPGQIDRVSTIMRAYEGREAVLLELLETKALIKANAEKEGAENLPSFLRNSSALQNSTTGEDGDVGENSNPISPLSNTGTSQPAVGGMMQDDISSMSGVSAPANGQAAALKNANAALGEAPHNEGATDEDVRADDKSKQSLKTDNKTPDREKKKKKGMFGGLFGRKNKKGKDTGNDTASKTSKSGKKKNKAGASLQSTDSI